MKHIKLFEEFVNEAKGSIVDSSNARSKILAVTENFPGPGETVDAKDLDYAMLDYFNRTNKKLLIDTKTKKGIKGSVGKMYNNLVFNGDDINKKDIVRVKILESMVDEAKEQKYTVIFWTNDDDTDWDVMATSPEDAIEKVKSGKVKGPYDQTLPRNAKNFTASLQK